jgi:hypothetical protein
MNINKLNIQGRILGSGKLTGRKWEIMAIKAGLSHNFSEEGARFYYSPEMLKESLALFDNKDVYAFEFKTGYFDHAPDSIAETKFTKGLIKNKVGQLTNPRWGKDNEGNEGIVCDLTLIDSDIADTLRESWESGLEDFAGYSLDGAGPYELQDINGVQVASVKIETIDSVDIVTSPAAGGKNLRLVAAINQNEKGSNMNPKLPHIRPHQMNPIPEHETGSIVLRLDKILIRKQKLPRHFEVRDNGVTIRKPPNQHLGPALNSLDRLANQRLHKQRAMRFFPAGFPKLDRFDRASVQPFGELAADRFDFGQFRHGKSLTRLLANEKPAHGGRFEGYGTRGGGTSARPRESCFRRDLA